MSQDLHGGEKTSGNETAIASSHWEVVGVKKKKELRLERKKRKLLALSAVMMLNDQEGLGKRNKHGGGNQSQQSTDSIPEDEQAAKLVSEAQLKTILASNRTAYDITEHDQNSPEQTGKEEEHENGPLVAKRRRSADDEEQDAGGNSATAAAPQNNAQEYRALKAYVNQKKSMRFSPRIILKPFGQDALLDRAPGCDRIPLLLDDIQALLMHTLLRTDSPSVPRWVSIQKSTKLTHTMVLIVEGFSCEDYVNLRGQHMPASSDKIFGPEHILHVVCPSMNLVEEMACVPLSDTHKDILVAEYGSLEAAMRICKDQMLVRRSIFRNIRLPVTTSAPKRTDLNHDPLDLPTSDKFPRTQLLLSPIQMINEGYPLPLTGTLHSRYQHYLTTSDFYLPVTPRSPMFGMDCEMCGIAGNKSVLTRVSIVDEVGNTVYDELVQPRQKIVDYRTEFSGITKEMLENVTKRLEDVQQEIRNLLPRDAILVGQSLNCDLDALQLLHPYVIDSSVIYNLTGNTTSKAKLRLLTKKFLDKDIQRGTDGHNPVEDCAASLDLVKLKLSQSIYFGDQWLQDRSNYHKFLHAGGRVGIATMSSEPDNNTPQRDDRGGANQHEQITSTLFAHAKKRNKRSSIVTNDQQRLGGFESYFKGAIREPNAWLSVNRMPTPDETVRKAAEENLQYDFNLAYVKLPQQSAVDKNSVSQEKVALAQQIDGWIQQLYGAMSLNGLFVVLLVSHEEPKAKSNRLAVAMVQTKK